MSKSDISSKFRATWVGPRFLNERGTSTKEAWLSQFLIHEHPQQGMFPCNSFAGLQHTHDNCGAG